MNGRKKKLPQDNNEFIRDRLKEIAAITSRLPANAQQVTKQLRLYRKTIINQINKALEEKYAMLDKKLTAEGKLATNESREYSYLKKLTDRKKTFILAAPNNEFDIIINAYHNISNSSIFSSMTDMLNDSACPSERIVNTMVEEFNNKKEKILIFLSSLIHITKIYHFYLKELANNAARMNITDDAKNAFTDPDYLFAPVKLLTIFNMLLKAILEKKLDSNTLYLDISSLQRKTERLIKQSEEYLGNIEDPLQKDWEKGLREIVGNLIERSPEPKSQIQRRVNGSSSNPYSPRDRKSVV